jgi:mRNA interferase HigB
MHIISRKVLRQFWERHPDSETALTRWFKIMQRTDFHNFNELRITFPAADQVDDWIVFNIGGNKLSGPQKSDTKKGQFKIQW